MASSALHTHAASSVVPTPTSVPNPISDLGSAEPSAAELPLDLDLSGDAPPVSPCHEIPVAEPLSPVPIPASPASPVLSPRLTLPPPALDLANQTIVLLDPSLLRWSQDYNREDGSFEGPHFRELVRSVIAHNGNLQPVCVVEQVDEQGNTYYTVVFGELRVRACREAQLPVRAMVMRSRPALESSLLRLGENRGRKELAPIEFGRQVKRVLDDPNCSLSKTQLAKMLGCHPGHVGRAYELASLSPVILEAFTHPLELQYAHMLPLKRAYEAQSSAVLEEAWAIREEFEPLSTDAVVERLVKAADRANNANKTTQDKKGSAVSEEGEATPAKKPSATTSPKRIRVKGRDIGRWEVMPTGAITLQIDEPMSELQRQELLTLVAAQFEENILKPKKAKDAARVQVAVDASQAAAGEVA